jgi:hypothetical protein
MKAKPALDLRVPMVCAAAALASVCLLGSASGQDITATAAPDAAARANWRDAMAHNVVSGEGCFHASYPSFVWEQVECRTAQPRVHPVHRTPMHGATEVTGNGDDYVAKAAGLISETLGTFPKVTGVKSEKSVGVKAFGGGGILGPNEYTLQVNSNYTGTTAACAGHSGCTVWQQFIYSPDYVTQGQAAVFMQYWLIGWGSKKCPSGFSSAGGGDCYGNSAYVTAPDMPITDLGKLTLSGSAVPGGKDTVVFNNGSEAYSISGKDSVLEISSVWTESEFNVVGNAGGSRADFNSGSSVTIKVALTDGSSAAPKCVADAGSTGETNNLDLGSCSATSGSTPYIQFTESN